MSLRLLVLGSGSALPTLNSNQSAQLLEAGNELYLIDCGEGTQIELRRRKVRIQRINHIFISHLHGDHFFGLVGLLSTMHLLGRKQELHIHGPKGLEEIIKIQFRNAGSHLSYTMKFHLVDQANQWIHEDKFIKVRSLPLKHRIETYGYLFEEQAKLRKLIPSALAKYKIPNYARKGISEGKDFTSESGEVIKNEKLSNDPPPPASFAYCSDTAYSEELVNLLNGPDLLYHEATFLDSEMVRAKKTYHSTAKDAARVANLSGAGSLIVGHFSNRYDNKERFLQEARPIFPETHLAEEGKWYEIGS